MAQGVKVLAAKPDALSLIPTSSDEGRKLASTSCLLTSTYVPWPTCVHMYTHMHTYTLNKETVKRNPPAGVSGVPGSGVFLVSSSSQEAGTQVSAAAPHQWAVSICCSSVAHQERLVTRCHQWCCVCATTVHRDESCQHRSHSSTLWTQ